MTAWLLHRDAECPGVVSDRLHSIQVTVSQTTSLNMMLAIASVRRSIQVQASAEQAHLRSDCRESCCCRTSNEHLPVNVGNPEEWTIKECGAGGDRFVQPDTL